MAETSWPSAAPATITEYDHELLWTARFSSGLFGDPADPMPVFADSTGLHVKFRRGRRAIVRGFAWSSGDTDVVKPVAANPSGQTRIDLATLRLDRSTWTVRAHIIQGTPGGGTPAAKQDPGPTGQWDLVLARITIPGGTTESITSSMVSGGPFYLGAPLIVANSVSGHPTVNDPRYGFRYQPNLDRLLFRRPNGDVRLWDDTGYIQLAQSNSNWRVEPSLPTVVRRINNVCWLRYGDVRRIAKTDLGDDVESTLPGQLPADMRIPHQMFATVRISGTGPTVGQAARIRVTTSGTFVLAAHNGVRSNALLTGFTLSWLVS